MSRVKSRILGGLTKKQLICFSAAAAIGIPVFFITKGLMGNSAAIIVMILFMLPAFFIAMYEKDGQPAEKILKNILRSQRYFPIIRPYKTENFYKIIETEALFDPQDQQTARAGKTPAKKRAVR
jgi:hypothetical protein